MSFFYDKGAGGQTLKIEGQLFEYIYKVRRTREDEKLKFRNLADSGVYIYQTSYVEKKSATLKLIGADDKPSGGNGIHIGWCVVDPKTVEKALPMLNELGVSKIDFIYSKRSQRNFNIRPERFESIIISSCQQCGRSDMMSFDLFESLEKWVKAQKEFYTLDFGGENLPKEPTQGVYLVGPEGGFAEDERDLLSKSAKAIFSLDIPLTLKSETACVMIASRFV